MNCSHDMDLYGWFHSPPELRAIFTCTKCGTMCRCSFAHGGEYVVWSEDPLNPPHPEEYTSVFGEYTNGK